ncbi:MAG: efflux RND transporter periplasmic adaptor subunit [Alphaproteobacteria bacterium]|jgi:multidrug efflux system membrane fusion protein|nr:efflux RND transporter periplasmic adaptor subunit [Alphaproteobacteria bacterium]
MKIRGSIITASILALAVGGWILSGQLGETPPTQAAEQNPAPATGAATKKERAPTAVRTRRITAEDYASVILVTGQTEASRQITIRSQLDGRVKLVGAKEGQAVKRGQMLMSFDEEDWPARVEEAEARVKQRELEHDAAKKLAKKGFQAQTRLAEAFANLQASKRQLTRMLTDLRNTVIFAPFGAVLNERHVEIGDVLRKGDEIAELIDLNPLLVTAHVSERDYLNLELGQAARAKLADGSEFPGVVRFVSSAADPNTRTFRVELEIPNPDAALVAGVTAELALPLPPIPAHRISAALFTLNSDGKLGLKTVDETNTVVFRPVRIVGGTDREVFVTGLPAVANVITVGQDFVVAGEKVAPMPEKNSPGASS